MGFFFATRGFVGSKFLQHLLVVLAEDYFFSLFFGFVGVCLDLYFFFPPILQHFMEMVPITLAGCL